MSERKAFVIMPFGEAFDEVYNLFIAETLNSAGYQVVRADNIRAQQNILKDIIVSLADAHLVVADLTDSNANVYYELGIAHALRRPVILLTQQLDELPFDLRSYRVIPYSTHFGEIKRAREALFELAKGAAEGTVPFGNPVLDFLGTSSGTPSLPGEPSAEAGLLDYLVGVEDSLSFLTQVTAEYTEETTKIGRITDDTTPRMQAALAKGSAREARIVIIGLAQSLSRYADKVADQNNRYTAQLSELRTALEFILRSQDPRSSEEVAQLRTFLDTLSTMEESSARARSTTSGLAETIRAVPQMERTFNRACDRTVRELELFSQNIEQTAAIVARAREIGESKLPKTSD